MTVANGPTGKTGVSQRREWTRTVAAIGIACLVFNALVVSGHGVRMAANAAGLGERTVLCTPQGAVSVPTASLASDGEDPRPTANPAWECPICAFAKLAGTFVDPGPPQTGIVPVATHRKPENPGAQTADAIDAALSARPRAPPLPA